MSFAVDAMTFRSSWIRLAQSRGFTLMEIVVVLSIMVILAALGAGSLVSGFEHSKVRQVASILSADLVYAQGMAARQRRPVVVILDPSLKFYLIRDRGSAVVYRQRFVGADTEYGVDLLDADPQTTVELFPNGAARTTTTFTIGLKDYARRVTLTRAGQIRLLPP